MPNIDELIRSRRRKTVALIVKPDGRLVVRAPWRLPLAQIQEIVDKKADWIVHQQAQARLSYRPDLPKHYQNGESFWFLGQRYPLEIVEASRPALRLEQRFWLARQALPHAEQAFIRWYREQARRILTERAAELAAKHGFRYERIRISSARTRWGSCSSNGTLSFPWRLVMAPPEAIDYVVVHELVHTRIKHHRRPFWEAVAAILPDYAERRQWLQTNGYLLTLTS